VYSSFRGFFCWFSVFGGKVHSLLNALIVLGVLHRLYHPCSFCAPIKRVESGCVLLDTEHRW